VGQAGLGHGEEGVAAEVAEAIRVPTKKALRKVGLVSPPRGRPTSP
jgi:hypothetical protein